MRARIAFRAMVVWDLFLRDDLIKSIHRQKNTITHEIFQHG